MPIEKIRVLAAKGGLDPHDRGVKLLMQGLRDAGMEVIYTGLHQTPESILRAAIEEDVHIICLSLYMGNHLPICERIKELLRENGADNIVVACGGAIPPEEISALKAMGVDAFGPMTSLEKVISYIKEKVA